MADNHSNDGEIEMPSLGLWSVFNSTVTAKRTIQTIQSDLNYFPLIPYAPNESVLKDYLDFLIDLKSDLEIDNIFCYSDQDVFYKISQIMWKEGDRYKGIINIMGGFHIPLVNLKILYKMSLLDLRGSYVKAKVIANGPIDKVLEGRHYSRGTRLHKEIFEVLFCFKCKSFEKDFQLNFFSKVKKLREETTHANLLALCNDENFKQIKLQKLPLSGTMGKWVTDNMRDVSKFFSRIAAY